MCEPVSIGLALLGTGMNVASSIAEGSANAATANRNAALAGLAAKDSEHRGNLEAGRYRQAGSEAIAEQKVAYATSGVDADSGSALLAAKDSRVRSELDALTARNNAAREAWGFRSQRDDFRVAAQQATTRGYLGAASNLLTGVSSAVGTYNRNKADSLATSTANNRTKVR